MKKKSLYLMTGVAVAALVAGAPGAFAQVAVNQSATNNTSITNSGTVTTNAGNLGIGASLGVSASGAVASTSVSGINQAFNSPTIGQCDSSLRPTAPTVPATS